MDASFSAAQESGSNMEEKTAAGFFGGGGETALVVAARKGHIAVVRYLVVRGEGGRGKGDGDR